jgi:hypothetical protein
MRSSELSFVLAEHQVRRAKIGDAASAGERIIAVIMNCEEEVISSISYGPLTGFRHQPDFDSISLAHCGLQL